MRFSPASPRVLAVAGFGLLLLSGCTPTATKSQRFIFSFVPPAPAPPQQVDLPEPPPYYQGLLDREAPGPLLAAMAAPPEPPESDRRIQRSEVLFQEGLRLQRSGEWSQARVEFDRALDVLLRAPANLNGRDLVEKRYNDLVEAIHRVEVEEVSRERNEPVFDRAPLDGILEKTFPIDPRLTPKIREQVAATVSQLPLEVNDSVMSYIHYFSTKGRGTLIGGLTRSGRYRGMIQRILDEEGLPKEIIFLAQAESGFLPRAVSNKMATGMWQFISSRGLEYGLKQTREIDDRLDPEKATRAAAKHLKDLYHEFGDWYLAVAAYNCGPMNVSRAVERTGYADFWEIRKRNALPRETSNYLPIIVAMTIMTKNPREYGLEHVTPAAPIEYDTIEVGAPTHLGLLADIVGIPLAEMKELNPAILRSVAPANYAVRVPKGTLKIASAGLDLVPAERRAAWRLHRVGAGDTVPVIARRYGIAEKSIIDINADCMTAEEGDLMVIPSAYPEPKIAVAPPTRGKRTYTTARAKTGSRRR